MFISTTYAILFINYILIKKNRTVMGNPRHTNDLTMRDKKAQE